MSENYLQFHVVDRDRGELLRLLRSAYRRLLRIARSIFCPGPVEVSALLVQLSNWDRRFLNRLGSWDFTYGLVADLTSLFSIDRREFSKQMKEKKPPYLEYRMIDSLTIRRCRLLKIMRSVSVEYCAGEFSEVEGRFIGQLDTWSAEDLLWTGAEFKRAVQTLSEEPGIGRIWWNRSAEPEGKGWYGSDADGVLTRLEAHSVRLLWLRMKHNVGYRILKPPKPFLDWNSHSAWAHNQTAGKDEYDLEVNFHAPSTWDYNPEERLVSHIIWNRSFASDGDLSFDLVSYLADYNHLLPRLSWRQFEELIAEIFTRMGFTVDLMPGSKDGGKDLVAIIPVSPAPNLLLVQCKHYPVCKVRVESVQAFEAVVERRGDGTSGVMVTSGWFTKGGVAWAEDVRSRLSLVDHDILIGWLHRYGWAKQSVVGGNAEVTKGLV